MGTGPSANGVAHRSGRGLAAHQPAFDPAGRFTSVVKPEIVFADGGQGRSLRYDRGAQHNDWTPALNPDKQHFPCHIKRGDLP
jgi:hypothetical protein